MEDNPGMWLGLRMLPVMLLLIWLAGIADVLRRRDLAVNERMLWFLVEFLLPLVGIFIYTCFAPRRRD